MAVAVAVAMTTSQARAAETRSWSQARVEAPGGDAAFTGGDIAGAASAVVALGAIGLVALFLSRRRGRATTP